MSNKLIPVSMTVSQRRGLGVRTPLHTKINPAYLLDSQDLFASVTYITSAGFGGSNILTQEKPS